MLDTEAAAAFDELTRHHVTEGLNRWPETFRQGQFVPAVEYLRAAQVRTLLMRAMARADGDRRPLRRLRPRPGHHESDRPPERGFPWQPPRHQRPPRPAIRHAHRPALRRVDAAAVAHAYQQATGHHLQRPPLEQFLAKVS